MTPIVERNWFGFNLRTMFVVMTVVAMLGGGCFAFTSFVQVSVGYSIETDFENMPENDRALKAWLRDQPGVVPRTVHVARPSGKNLFVNFIMSRNLRGQPGVPDLDAACGKLGYGGPVGAFRDSERTSWREKRDSQ